MISATAMYGNCMFDLLKVFSQHSTIVCDSQSLMGFTWGRADGCQGVVIHVEAEAILQRKRNAEQAHY